MGKTLNCSFCGKESKIIYICPECGNTYCYEHRNKQAHNCNKNEENKDSTEIRFESIRPDEEEIYENPIPESSNEGQDPSDAPQEQDNLLTTPEFIFKDEANETPSNIKIISIRPDEEEIYENPIPESSIKEQDNLLTTPEFIFKPKANEEIEEKSSEDKRNTPSISIQKLIVASILIVLLSTIYLYTNGSLSSIVPKSSQTPVDGDNLVNYSLIKMEYDELNIKYKKLESDYFELDSEYNELKELYDSNIEFNGSLVLEDMKQITIPADSTTIFYYEIPSPGYVTIEYYSDMEIYAVVGSTKLDNVYYSRQPLNSKSSEFVFSVPVLPDLNIMFVNPDRQSQATLFFRVDYYCP